MSRMDAEPNQAPVLSLVTPAFREQQNLPVLYQRISNALGSEIGIALCFECSHH